MGAPPPPPPEARAHARARGGKNVPRNLVLASFLIVSTCSAAFSASATSAGAMLVAGGGSWEAGARAGRASWSLCCCCRCLARSGRPLSQGPVDAPRDEAGAPVATQAVKLAALGGRAGARRGRRAGRRWGVQRRLVLRASSRVRARASARRRKEVLGMSSSEGAVLLWRSSVMWRCGRGNRRGRFGRAGACPLLPCPPPCFLVSLPKNAPIAVGPATTTLPNPDPPQLLLHTYHPTRSRSLNGRSTRCRGAPIHRAPEAARSLFVDTLHGAPPRPLRRHTT
jgi:hypothetical protein